MGTRFARLANITTAMQEYGHLYDDFRFYEVEEQGVRFKTKWTLDNGWDSPAFFVDFGSGTKYTVLRFGRDGEPQYAPHPSWTRGYLNTPG